MERDEGGERWRKKEEERWIWIAMERYGERDLERGIWRGGYEQREREPDEWREGERERTLESCPDSISKRDRRRLDCLNVLSVSF